MVNASHFTIVPCLMLMVVCCPTCGELYVYEGRNCSECPPGTLVQHHCTANQDTECAPCPKGTYSNVPNRSGSCKRCRTECPKTNRAHSFVLRDCTDTHDIICSCGEGFWFDNIRGLCLPHRNCSPGFIAIKNGTHISDVICGKTIEKSWIAESATTPAISSTIVSPPGPERIENTVFIVLGISVASLIFLILSSVGIALLLKRRKGYVCRSEQRLLSSSEDGLLSIMPGTKIEAFNSESSAPDQREAPSSVIDNLETFNYVNRSDYRYTRVAAGSNTLETSAEINENEIERSCDTGYNTLHPTHASKNAPSLPIGLPPAVCNWPKGRDFDTHECNKTYQYDNAGGELVLSRSVKLSIPPNAIKPGDVYGVKGGPVKNVQEFHDFFGGKKDEDVISSVYHYDVDERKQFRSHVRLVLKHCIHNPEAWKAIKVYHCPSADFPSQLTEVPLKSKDNNVIQSMYYVVENNQTVSVYTTHFSVYLASGDRKRNTNIKAHVYAKPCARVDGSPNSTKLRVYLSDSYQHIADNFKEFKVDMEKDGYKKVDSKDLVLPKEIDSETRINVLLEPCNCERSPEKCGDGQELFPSNQEVTVDHFVDHPTPACAAEWILKNSQNQNNLKANLILTATYVPPKPKLNFLASLGLNNNDRVPETTRTSLVVEFALRSDMIEAEDVLVINKVLLSEISDDDWRNLVDAVAKEMRTTEIRPFGVRLGNTNGSLDSYEYRYREDKEEIIRQICMDWKNAKPDETLGVFIGHLPDSVTDKIGEVVSGIVQKPNSQLSRGHLRRRSRDIRAQ